MIFDFYLARNQNQMTKTRRIPQFKVAVIGAASVGKTTYLRRFITGEFTGNANFSRKFIFDTNEGRISMEFLESCEVTSLFVHAYLLIYDVHQEASFHHAKTIYQQIVGQGKPIVLCGNKVDDLSPFNVSSYLEFILAERVTHYMISAKSNYNFEKPFVALLRKLVNSQLYLVEAPPVLPPEVLV